MMANTRHGEVCATNFNCVAAIQTAIQTSPKQSHAILNEYNVARDGSLYQPAEPLTLVRAVGRLVSY